MPLGLFPAVLILAKVIGAAGIFIFRFHKSIERTPLIRDEFAAIALGYDTSMSHAMLRALGIPIPHRMPRDGEIIACDRYDGIAECMRQRHGLEM